MQNSIQIEPDELGNVIRVSKNNPIYGHVRITQERVSFSANGWVKNSKLSALIHGEVEDLKTIGIADMKTLPGKIVVRESTDPFSADNPDRDLKIAGDTGVVCCSHGEPIYRKTFYDGSGMQDDEFIPHTNGEAIKEANGAASAASNADLKNVQVSAEDLAEIKNSIAEETEETQEVDEELDTVETEESEETFEL